VFNFMSVISVVPLASAACGPEVGLASNIFSRATTGRLDHFEF
jgi:hypothetical protein